MDYQLLVLDVDGTATNSAKQVTEKTRDAVIRLQERGVRVVIASGRAPNGVYPVAEALELPRFGSHILAFNGAKIIRLKNRVCLYERTLPTYIPEELWRDSQNYHLGFLTYKDDILAAGTKPDQYMALESEISAMPIEYHRNFWETMDDAVNGCLLTGRPSHIREVEPILREKYEQEVEMFRSEPCFLEVVPKDVDKARSLKRLLKRLNIPREAVVCCGDSFNDITMIQYAGVGVAMANAQEELKLAADYVTQRDNDHDGVVEVIEKFFGNGSRTAPVAKIYH